MPLRLIPAPPGISGPSASFTYAVAPPPAFTVTHITASSRTPSAVAPETPRLPETPVKRFPVSTMNIFHARGMDNGEPGLDLYRCMNCGRVVMETVVQEHAGEKQSCLCYLFRSDSAYSVQNRAWTYGWESMKPRRRMLPSLATKEVKGQA